MSDNSKYRMFKNFMYNDLGITKEDIREWTKEAVAETALKFVTNKMSDYDTDDLRIYLSSLIRREVQSVLKEMVKEMVKDKVKVIDNLISNVKVTIGLSDKK